MNFIESESDSDVGNNSAPNGEPSQSSLELSFALKIEVDRPLNRLHMPEPGSKITKLEVTRPTRYDADTDETIQLADSELEEIAYPAPILTLIDLKTEYNRPFIAPNKSYFTIKDFLEAVKEFETVNRPLTKWFGEIDLHHKVFEGLQPVQGGRAYSIIWGA